jgi:hypothetical protein
MVFSEKRRRQAGKISLFSTPPADKRQVKLKKRGNCGINYAFTFPPPLKAFIKAA